MPRRRSPKQRFPEAAVAEVARSGGSAVFEAPIALTFGRPRRKPHRLRLSRPSKRRQCRKAPEAPDRFSPKAEVALADADAKAALAEAEAAETGQTAVVTDEGRRRP